MGFLDRLLGRDPSSRPEYGTPPGQHSGEANSTRPTGTGSSSAGNSSAGGISDEAAIERYRYLLRTAPPDAVEQAHREAFSQLTPEQRRQVLTELGSQVPAAERATSDDPQALARMATRAEMRRPGTLERSFGGGMSGGMGGGVGMGGLIAGSLLASVAGAFVGTAIADAMFDASDTESDPGDGDNTQADGADAGDGGGADSGTENVDSAGGAEGGSDFGDFGGGDFGDFGGGDF